MDIFAFALRMEQEGEAFYRDLEQKAPLPGLRHILAMLADDERKHQRVLEQLRAAGRPEMAQTAILDGARSLFADMTWDAAALPLHADQTALYRQAQELEKRSREFYLQKAGEVREAAPRDLLTRLADEENRHFFLLENIIQFVSRPQSWIENAEFNHLDEY